MGKQYRERGLTDNIYNVLGDILNNKDDFHYYENPKQRDIMLIDYPVLAKGIYKDSDDEVKRKKDAEVWYFKGTTKDLIEQLNKNGEVILIRVNPKKFKHLPLVESFKPAANGRSPYEVVQELLLKK